jgi:hypothetical protein
MPAAFHRESVLVEIRSIEATRRVLTYRRPPIAISSSAVDLTLLLLTCPSPRPLVLVFERKFHEIALNGSPDAPVSHLLYPFFPAGAHLRGKRRLSHRIVRSDLCG